jgi:hypothetical protein
VTLRVTFSRLRYRLAVTKAPPIEITITHNLRAPEEVNELFVVGSSRLMGIGRGAILTITRDVCRPCDYSP